MEKGVPSLSHGLHETQTVGDDSAILAGMSEREQILYDYNRQRDMSKVTVIPAKKIPGLYDLSSRLRVVVYCRVSTDGLGQATSFELQRKYYLKFVREHAQWKLIAMYSDEGITATSTEKRIGLLQMLEDAKAGKFDVIIVKNLSRLSRNLMDCMNIIYALRNLPNPVGIYFESEKLYTLDKTADFTLQVLSLVAQEESHKKSEAMLASYFMRFSQGQYMVPDLLGYKKAGKNRIAIDIEEAKTVQLIFMMYLAGYSPKTIANVLTRLGRKTHVHVTKSGEVKGGIVKWTASSVRNVLINERRCGDVLAQKTVTESYLTHKTKKNIDTLPKFYAVDQHPGIVNASDFLLTQRFLAANRGGWTGKPPEMRIFCDGALKGFVSVTPRWCGYSAEDYNRASLRAYGVEETQLSEMGGSVEKERAQQVTGVAGHPASEATKFQYRYSIDSDDYNQYPDASVDEEQTEEKEQLNAFAEHVRKLQEELASKSIDKAQYGHYDLSGCERICAEMFSLTEKVCVSMDRNGILFNTYARKKLSGSDGTVEFVELAYNPVMKMMVVRIAEQGRNALHWAAPNKNNIMMMRRCSSRGFMNALFDNMGWNMEYKYKVVGTVMMIDNEPTLVFTFDDPICTVPINYEADTVATEKRDKDKRDRVKETKVLLEAGFAPEDYLPPEEYQLSNLPEIDLGSSVLNDKARNAARSRAIYYDNYTSASGAIHLADLGEEKFDPECIRQIIQKKRAPEEGWFYLRGMAVIRKKSFTIYPRNWYDSLGNSVYDDWRQFRPTGRIGEGIPYGWTQALTLPSEATVQEAINMLCEEMTEAT